MPCSALDNLYSSTHLNLITSSCGSVGSVPHFIGRDAEQTTRRSGKVSRGTRPYVQEEALLQVRQKPRQNPERVPGVRR